MTLTNEQKNQIIASKVGIDTSHIMLVHDYEGTMGCDDFKPTEWSCECGFKGDTIRSEIHREKFPNPDFFTPEGQKVLCLHLQIRSDTLSFEFLNWLNSKYKGSPEWLTIIAETKLAELFFEFCCEEKLK